MALLPSLLRKGLAKIPGESVDVKALPNVLKKQGVKDEELKFADLDLPEKGRVTKTELAEAEKGRKDKFGVQQGQGDYQAYSLTPGKENPTYRENVYTFADGKSGAALPDDQRIIIEDGLHAPVDSDEAELYRDLLVSKGFDLDGIVNEDDFAQQLLTQGNSRYTSDHFTDVPDYLMHTRTYTDTIDGKPTHVVQEIQSDLHQQGRQAGYGASKHSPEEREILEQGMTAEVGTDEAEVFLDLLYNKGYDDVESPETFARKLLEETGVGIPESPYKSSWLSKGIEREIAVAMEEGKEQIAIPIKGAVSDLNRAEGVQKWYENNVASTAKKIAKANNMDFKIVTQEVKNAPLEAGSGLTTEQINLHELNRLVQEGLDGNEDVIFDMAEELGWPGDIDISDWLKTKELTGTSEVEYAVLTPKAGMRPEFSLYSMEAGSVLMAFEASKAGYSEEEIKGELVKKGYTEEEATKAAAQSAKAAAAGYSSDELMAHLTGQEPQVATRLSEPTAPVEPPPEATAFGQAYRELTGNEELAPEDLVAKLQIVAPNTSFMTTNIAGFFGNEEAARISEEAATASNNRIIELAKARGLNLEMHEGEFFAQTDEGLVEVTPGFWNSFWENKGELVGAIGGGIAGGSLGFSATAAAPFPGARVLGTAAGSLVGAVAGSVAGSELDYLHNAIVLQEDMNASVALRKALNATEASIVGDVIGLGLFKAGKSSFKAIVNAKKYIAGGNNSRAKLALQEQLFIDDEVADELVTKLSKVAQVPGKSRTEQEIAAAALTRPGAEGLVKASTNIDPKASASVKHAINTRAQDVLTATADASDPNIGRLIKGELESYTSAVKENFARVKAVPAQSPKANNFQFDYDKLAVEPALAKLSGNIDNPDVAYKFAKQAQRIRDMSSTRSFSDLLELRTLVNDFKFNKRIRSAKDFDMLNKVLANIDGGIEQAAHATLDNPKQWLAEFADARLDYAKMKQLEKNVITKLVGRKGVDESVIAKSLTKYAYAIDDTFVEAMSVLPRATRNKAEGAVLEHLVKTYTAGVEGGMRATNFPLLAKQLNDVTFSSPRGRSMKRAILELSEVFKNDVPLAQVAGDIQIPKFQSFLTADPVVRAKFELASGVFNQLKSLAPGSNARALALVKKTAKVLENPLHAKSINELVDEFAGEVDVSPVLEKLASEAAKRKAATGAAGMPKLVMYGDGKVLRTSGKGAKQSVPVHRIATIEEVAQIAEVTGINRADRKALDRALLDRGYSAVQLGAESIRRIQ